VVVSEAFSSTGEKTLGLANREDGGLAASGGERRVVGRLFIVEESFRQDAGLFKPPLLAATNVRVYEWDCSPAKVVMVSWRAWFQVAQLWFKPRFHTVPHGSE
jgi:hypothetical protein